MTEKHPALMYPRCCANRIQPLLYAIFDGGGTVMLPTLCHSCQTGANIALDYTGASAADKLALADLMAFGEATGFKPTILFTEEAKQRHIAAFHEQIMQVVAG